VWERGSDLAVALNLSEAAASVPDLEGTILISTIRARDGDRVDDALELAPWEAAIVQRAG
jgi:hypothetical protein